jgi:hypothetical protein
MKMTFKRALGAAAVTILFFLFNSYLTSCKPPVQPVEIKTVNGTFSSQIAFTNSSQTTVKCTSAGCASSDTSGTVGGTKYILTGTIVTDSSGDYHLALIITPKGDSANAQRIEKKSK